VRMKRCVGCGGDYEIAFFRRDKSRASDVAISPHRQVFRDRCIGCESTSKRSELLDQRLRRKAMGARRRHGNRLAEQGMIRARDDLEEVYGWDVDKMVEDIKRVIREGCEYCTFPLISEDGYGGITVDILNPDLRPHYVTNVRWCCSRCNSEKQRVSPEVWGARRVMWEQWRRNIDRREADPEAFGLLDLDQRQHPNETLPLW
jgi:hypothetical protein